MAYIQNTAFWPRVNNRVFSEDINITGKFHNGEDADEICSAGFLCVKDTLMDCEGYENVGPSGSEVTLKNSNSWIMKVTGAAVKSEGDGIYACNPYDVNMVQDPVTGNLYKVGANTLGLPEPAGYPVTFTKIVFTGDKIYRFGIGNVSAAIGTNKFFTIANGLLVPAAAAPTDVGTPYFKLLPTGGTFTEGAQSAFEFVDVLACKVDAAAG